MNGPWHTDNGPQDESPPPGGGFGWGERADRRRHRAAAPRPGTDRHRNGTLAWDHPSPAPERNTGTTGVRNDDALPERNSDATGERNDRADRADDAGVPGRHEIVVPDAADPAVLTGRAGEAAQQWVDGFRFVNLRLGSLREILRFAEHAEYNLGHLPPIRSANIAFFRLVTVPFLTLARFIEWAFLVRLHRAVTSWALLLVVAHFLNRLFDWAVPNWLDAWTWSATAWQWAAGGLFAFVLTSVGVFLRGPR